MQISEPSEEQQGLTFSDFVATNSFFQPLATARGLNTTYQSLVLAGETSLGTDGVELEARVAFARAGLVFNYSLEQALLPADFLLSNELGGPGFCQSKEEDAVAFSFDFAGQPFDMPEGPSLPNDASKAQELQKLAFEFQEMSVVEEGYEPSPGDQVNFIQADFECKSDTTSAGHFNLTCVIFWSTYQRGGIKAHNRSWCFS